MKTQRIFGTFVLLFFGSAVFAADPTPKPKYGPEATVLSESHEYFRKNAAPDFWALIPYYAPQMDDSACSVASLSTVVNGARVGKKLSADDELVTQQALVKKVKHKGWNKGLLKRQVARYGISLDQLGEITREALTAYGVAPTSVEVVHADSMSDEMKSKLHKALVENEKSARDFIILNFDQQIYTSDAQVGHIAPIGAYDAEKKRVLVLDPDRRWYEPYWVSEETILKGMNTRDSSVDKFRGYVWVKF